MDAAERYKQEKVNFVSDITGSSVYHVNAISLVALVSIALYASFTTRFPTRAKGLTSQWTLLVLPLLLSMTLFATAPFTLSILLLTPTILLLWVYPRRDISSPLPSSKRSSRNATSTNKPPKFPFMIALTVYRAHMMLMTVLAILAVDFPVFPRMLAKCETFGVSLMDLGVGSFVFSQGLVSAIPLISQPYHLLEPTSRKLLQTIRKSISIIVLGGVRVLLVKGTDYPEHVTEYGVHWNFFITLALLPIFQVILHPLLSRYLISFIGLFLAFLQQTFLSSYLSSFILTTTTPRTTLLTQNKEGISSLLGYLSIHILGLSLGTVVLPCSPGWFRRHQVAVDVFRRTGNRPVYFDEVGGGGANGNGYRQTGKTAQEVWSYTFIWWLAFYIVRLAGVGDGGEVSRRMVNLPYILWVVAFNTSFFLGYLVLLDIVFYPQPDPIPTNRNLKKKNDDNRSSTAGLERVIADGTPTLLRAINRHGLLIFLIANLLTGGVNLSMRTMYTKDLVAMGILGAYSFVVCGVAWWLDRRR